MTNGNKPEGPNTGCWTHHVVQPAQLLNFSGFRFVHSASCLATRPLTHSHHHTPPPHMHCTKNHDVTCGLYLPSFLHNKCSLNKRCILSVLALVFTDVTFDFVWAASCVFFHICVSSILSEQGSERTLITLGTQLSVRSSAFAIILPGLQSNLYLT